MASTLTLAISACGAQPRTSTVDSRSEASTNARVTSSPGATTSATGRTTELSADDFASQSFDRSTVIDNKWFPLRPGTTHVYEGSANEGTDRVVRRNILIVTDLTKVIDGVRAVVIWERDYDDGELIESELALFAQANDGNVWHLGQYPEVYEEGKLVETPTWIHGLAGARAGITMKQEPKLGAPDYAQGFAPPPLNWVDRARVYKTGGKNCVPAGCYQNVLVTQEFEKDTPNASQLKYYAAGVGNVRVGWVGGADEEKEVLELVKAGKLSPAELAQARKEALVLEKRAHQISKAVYARTARAQ